MLEFVTNFSNVEQPYAPGTKIWKMSMDYYAYNVRQAVCVYAHIENVRTTHNYFHALKKK